MSTSQGRSRNISAQRNGKSLAPLGTTPEVRQALRVAQLRYVTTQELHIQRLRAGKGFVYRRLDGKPVRTAGELRRIRSLAIPPAWQEVWICALPNGHLQAVGRDERGRKQYRYHPRWRALREETKYDRLLAFARALPALRRRVALDLSRPGQPREKVLALVTRLLEETLIRVGNEEYTRLNGSFGLTTLRDHHARINGAEVQFTFRGKSGVAHRIAVTDRRLARLVKSCQELPGQVLFQYLDETGKSRSVSSGDVNAYLKEITGADFTAKDFRTWAGTVLAAQALQQLPTATTIAQAKRQVVQAVVAVAKRLGNTPAICRHSYIHPAVITGYLAGNFQLATSSHRVRSPASTIGLRAEERAVVRFLRQQLAR